uniref:Nucleolar protein 16 n=1 Tax=Phasianus colchicus TaxID=9054 RepID=A0A669PSL2_PHACC
MPKAKGKNRRQKFAYGLNRKRLYRSARRKAAPRIECSHIRHAWDATKSVAQNLAEMGLAGDPNKAVPIGKRRLQVSAESDGQEQEKTLVRKPYVLSEMEFEASLPEKKSNTLSRDLIDYVRYMIQNHGENYKVSTRRRWMCSDCPFLSSGLPANTDLVPTFLNHRQVFVTYWLWLLGRLSCAKLLVMEEGPSLVRVITRHERLLTEACGMHMPCQSLFSECEPALFPPC